MEHVRADLEQYQLDMIEFVKRVPRCALWVPIGAGKTISTLTAFNDLYMNLDAYRALVIAPLRVAEKVWADEIKDWAHVRGLRFMFLTGSAKAIENKIRRYMPVVDVWGLSCDSVHVLARLYLARPIPWDWLIVDESSRFKKASTKRTKSLRLLTIHPPRVTELTGTPMSNGVKDIWSQIYMLDRGQRLGPTMNGFKERFFIGASGGITETPNKVAQIRIQKAIADIVYVLRPEEFKSERKPLTNLIHLDLGPKLQADYDKFKRRLVLDTLKSEKVIKAVNAAAITQKLLQFASGWCFDEEHVAHHVHDIKLDALKELVEDNQGLPLLVGYGFTHEVAAIKKAFPQAELFGKDPAQQDRWNRGEIPMLLAHPRSAGHGLNLQFGGHILVWYSWGYDLEVHVQMCGRLPRKGQKNQVIMHYLTMRNTIDELVTQALTHKDREQVAFQSSLKQHILDIVKSLKGAA